MEVFPEGVMVHRNILQAEGMHYPRQQETAMKILNKMEKHSELCYINKFIISVRPKHLKYFVVCTIV